MASIHYFYIVIKVFGFVNNSEKIVYPSIGIGVLRACGKEIKTFKFGNWTLA